MNTKRIWLALALVTLGCPAPRLGGAVAEGENLVLNGTFDAEQVDFPEFWTPSSSREVSYRVAGGPEGKRPCVILKPDGSTANTISLRQQGMTLVAGEPYKLSAWVKTKGFRCRAGGVILHNNGWISATGISKLPVDSDWTFYERTFTLMPSENREYGLAVYAVRAEGELHVADVRLEAVSEAARQGSTSQASLIAAPRLVPLQPLLNRIPRSDPEVTFRLFGLLPEKREAYELLLATPADGAPRPAVPIGKDGKVSVSLAGLGCGEHELNATVRHRGTRKTVIENSYPATIIDLPPLDSSRIRPLNRLVSELLSEPVKGSPAPQRFRFVHPRDGWVFVSLSPQAAPAPELSVRLDDRDAVITAATDRGEAFRELSRGEHAITVTGNSGDARLVVRSIPEIFDYPPCASSQVRENGSYGWDFMKRHVLHAVTTLNGGVLPGEALGDAKARGLRWLANFNVQPRGKGDDGDLRGRMEKTAGMTQPQYDGFTSDELFFGRTTIDVYTQALRGLRNPQDRLIYTWIVGKPGIGSLHTDFMSAALNASRGRGRLLFEAYCHPQADEKAAAAYLDGMITETIRRFDAFFPNAAAGTGIIFGNFNQIPIISLEHDPAVDFKYFLDMQVHLVANNPEFADLATVGYWGTYYGDEELARWSFKLMRHYAVEGRKDMLSSRYGFSYNPGHLHNPDFADGLKGWTPSPAAGGALRADRVAGYGKSSQGRWGGGTAGDTVCVLVRQADRPNRVSQIARGLQPGRAYCLQFVTADWKDVTAKRFNPRRYGIRADLAGAEIIEGRSFVHIDRRKTAADGKEKNVGKINLHRIVFRARAPTQVVAFDDGEALPGEELMLNFVQLKPYLE